MAIYTEIKHQQIEALKEGLVASKMCLLYKKEENQEWENQDGCLGVPALIVLSSLIDTLGSFFRDSEAVIYCGIDGNGNKIRRKIESASDHFLVLNHEDYFGLNLRACTIYDFYSSYRSKITHNSSLPLNNFIENTPTKKEIFRLNNEHKIVSINLYALHDAVSKAIGKFIDHLERGTFSEEHKLTEELNMSKKLENDIENVGSLLITGVTYSIKTD